MFKKLSRALILTTTLSAEPITPDNVGYYYIGAFNIDERVAIKDVTTLRGGISRDVDLVTSKEIIKNLLENIDRTTILNTKNIEEIAQRLITNVDTYSGFGMIKDNMPARRMYISLCARILISNQSLTESGCLNNARQALATFGGRNHAFFPFFNFWVF